MAPGYIIAIGLEASGLLALTLGLALSRFERRSKASGLKRFLSSGQTLAPDAVARPVPQRPASGVATFPSPRLGTASEAVLALRRAFAAPFRSPADPVL